VILCEILMFDYLLALLLLFNELLNVLVGVVKPFEKFWQFHTGDLVVVEVEVRCFDCG
jgi:hypothetical protein